jgi:GxxExxY protein
MTDLLFKEKTYKILGICMEIHKVLGVGLKEINYKDAMEIDFIDQEVPYKREERYVVKYKDKVLRNPYVADFVVDDSLIIEVKSTSAIIDSNIRQALSYLTVSGMKLGLVINFGEKSLTWKRIIL